MDLVYFNKKTFCPDIGPNGFLDYAMFHGLAERKESNRPLDSYFTQRNLGFRLYLERSGDNIPPIFQPNLSLVVCEDVKKLLSSISGISFLDVKFLKLFRASRFRLKQLASGEKSSEDIIDKAIDDPSLHDQIGNYYELIVPSVALCLNSSKDLALKVNVLDRSSWELSIGSEFVSKYPFFYGRGFFSSEEIFDMIKPYIDLTFFYCTTVRVSKT